ncbi:MAG: 3'-5' exonuclease [Eubacteriales bacterium]|nr:3'-5' exonuclease [Eubacteriales bacterium]
MNHLFELPDSYVCVDLETTGLNPCRDKIIEIGAVKVKDNEITDTFQTLVDPGYHISSFITGLTGITDDMLSSAPGIFEALPEFLNFADGNILMGHNIHSFDIKFISSSCLLVTGKPFDGDHIDTLYLSRKLFPYERHHRLCDLITRFNIAEREEHRALSDALQTVDCYNYMRKYMQEHGITPEEIRPCRRSGY